MGGARLLLVADAQAMPRVIVRCAARCGDAAERCEVVFLVGFRLISKKDVYLQSHRGSASEGVCGC